MIFRCDSIGKTLCLPCASARFRHRDLFVFKSLLAIDLAQALRYTACTGGGNSPHFDLCFPTLYVSSRLPKGLWFPCDFYLSVSFSRDRLLHVPTVLCGKHNVTERSGKATLGYVRVELWLLLHVCIILDFKRL